MTPLVLRATLPLPPSINHTYVPTPSGQAGKRLRMNEKASNWKESADAWLLLAGWRRVTSQPEALVIRYHLYCCGVRGTRGYRDIDAISKILIDAACGRVELDDELVCRLEADRTFVSSARDHRVEVEMEIIPAVVEVPA